jgi:hypothetical protein
MCFLPTEGNRKKKKHVFSSDLSKWKKNIHVLSSDFSKWKEKIYMCCLQAQVNGRKNIDVLSLDLSK